MKVYKLAPMETRAISINELIRVQEPDDQGHKLVLNSTSGEVGWQANSTQVAGRILQASPAMGMAKNFSCQGYFYQCSISVTPNSSLNLTVGSSGNLGDITPVVDTIYGTLPSACACNSSPSDANLSLTYSWGTSTIAILTAGEGLSFSTWKGTSAGTSDIPFSTDQTQYNIICNGQAPVTVTPSITFNNANITNSTQNVVVGQQIYLSGLPSGGTCSIAGTYVGGFQNASSGGYEQLAALNGQTVLFYWTVQASNVVVTYTVSGSAAKATFNITGPTYGGITATAAPPSITTSGGTQYLVLGPGNGPGIKMTGSEMDNPSYPGQVSWLQVQAALAVKLVLTNGTNASCSAPNNELDNRYPYTVIAQGGKQSQDSPNAVLTSSWKRVEDIGSFQMFVLWQSNLSNSIPVPLGLVSWQWDGVATFSAAWSTSSPSATYSVSTPSKSAYPSWGGTFVNGALSCDTVTESGGMHNGLRAGVGPRASTALSRTRTRAVVKVLGGNN